MSTFYDCSLFIYDSSHNIFIFIQCIHTHMYNSPTHELFTEYVFHRTPISLSLIRLFFHFAQVSIYLLIFSHMVLCALLSQVWSKLHVCICR